MATKLLYLEDFDVVECEAVVEGSGETADENNHDGENDRMEVMLNQTCFYPRGGGQDWDTGEIRSDSGVFKVEEVRLDENGVVHHFGSFVSGELKVGETAQCKVDKERRSDNTRLHSAGHIIDMAASTLVPDWIAGRGAHYPHMSFVEYEVPEDAVADESFQTALQAKIDELLKSDYENKTMFIDKSEMSQYCHHVPDNIPTNKPSRIVLYADNFGIPCGGTHVKRVTEIGGVTVTKIKIKKGIAKVSYAVPGVN